MKYNYHAITLDKRDIGETDRLYTFYTRESGLMRVPARAIRKGEAKLAAQVEDFVLSHITIAKNYGHGTLTGAVAEEYFVALHENYHALLCMDRARSVFLVTVGENDCDEHMFILFVRYISQLNILAQGNLCDENYIRMHWITNAFLIKLFALEGYTFDVKKCCICKKRVTETRNGFSISHGGVLCIHCFGKECICYIDPDTLKAMRIIQDNKLRSLTKVVVHDKVYKQLERIVSDIEQWIMR